MPNKLETHFAPAQRDSKENIDSNHNLLERNEIAQALLKSKNGTVIVVNKRRQIVSISDDYLQQFGNGEIEAVLGLRLGELLHCVHCKEMPGGCGTSKSCVSCGAIIAMLTCFDDKKSVTRNCALHTSTNKKEHNDLLKVVASPLDIENERFVVLYLQNITKEQNWEVLQQVFFHDINNLLTGLSGISDILLHKSSDDLTSNKLTKKLHSVSTRIKQEIAFQQCLFEIDNGIYHTILQPIDVHLMMLELENFFLSENIANHKTLKIRHIENIIINSDVTLINKILHNLIKNAFEATEKGQIIKVKYFVKDESVNFEVHNEKEINKDVQEVMFERNFSTKSDKGRGVGLYSVKMFGEKFLKGKISFESSAETGTTFRFSLPMS